MLSVIQLIGLIILKISYKNLSIGISLGPIIFQLQILTRKNTLYNRIHTSAIIELQIVGIILFFV